MNRKIVLLLIAALVLVIMMFALSGTGVAQGKPACVESKTCVKLKDPGKEGRPWPGKDPG